MSVKEILDKKLEQAAAEVAEAKAAIKPNVLPGQADPELAAAMRLIAEGKAKEARRSRNGALLVTF